MAGSERSSLGTVRPLVSRTLTPEKSTGRLLNASMIDAFGMAYVQTKTVDRRGIFSAIIRGNKE